jgi:hypothetical protein
VEWFVGKRGGQFWSVKSRRLVDGGWELKKISEELMKTSRAEDSKGAKSIDRCFGFEASLQLSTEGVSGSRRCSLSTVFLEVDNKFHRKLEEVLTISQLEFSVL